MIQEITDYVATQLSKTVDTNIFSRELPDNCQDGSIVLYEGRYADITTDPNNLTRVEIIVDGISRSPATAEAAVRSVVSLLVNKAGITITGVGTCSFTGKPPRYVGRLEQRRLYRAELVVAY